MIIQVNSAIKECNHAPSPNPCNDQELKQKFSELFEQEKNSPCQVNWLGEDKVEVQGASSMSLHNFTLQAEAMGKKVKYYKKTIIEIV